jgi:threonine/homoserine/homoserine lactone efflux protein
MEQHNMVMPHSAFCGQTPEVIYFGTGDQIPSELKAAHQAARQRRMAENRAARCNPCGPAAGPPMQLLPGAEALQFQQCCICTRKALKCVLEYSGVRIAHMGWHHIPVNQLYVGVILGLVSSMPLGPINLTLVATTLRAELQRAIAMAAAVAVVDGCYAFVAASAISALHTSMPSRRYVQLGGAVVVVAYGLYLIATDKTVSAAAEPIRSALSFRDVSLGALTGVVLYVSNPTFLVFWLSAAGALRSSLPVATPADNWLFGAGVVLGTASWFAFLLYTIRHSLALASPVLVQRLAIIASCILIGLGGYAFIAGLRRLP